MGDQKHWEQPELESFARIVADAERQLDGIKPEIEALSALAHRHIQQRYLDALEELRRHFDPPGGT